MTPLVRAEFPLAMPLLLAWIGIPRWMTLQHPDTAPGFSAAHAYLARQDSAGHRQQARTGTGDSLSDPRAGQPEKRRKTSADLAYG
jgi:hypothetical protein